MAWSVPVEGIKYRVHDHETFSDKYFNISGEQGNQVTDLLVVTVQITCCHCTRGSVRRETLAIIDPN